LLNITSAEIAIGKILIGEGKVSIDYIDTQGFKSPTLDHRPHEIVKSEPTSVKRGSNEEFAMGADFLIGK